MNQAIKDTYLKKADEHIAKTRALLYITLTRAISELHIITLAK